MRRFSARMFSDEVTILPLVYAAQDAAGGRKKTWPGPGTDCMASVQLGHAQRRGDYQGSTKGEVEGVAYFGSPAAVGVDARLVWHVVPTDPTQDRTFGVLGPATPEAGRDSLYAVAIREVR